MPRLLRELLGLSALCGALLATVLLAAQLVQLSRILPGSLWELGWSAGGAAGLGLVALLEVLLPLCGLFGATLVFARLRAEGGLVAAWALGQRPRTLLLPALGVGLLLGAGTLVSATVLGPRALAALAATVEGTLCKALEQGEPVPLPGGGEVRRVGKSGELWAILPKPDAPPTVLRAGTFGGATLGDVWLWGPAVRAHVGTLALPELGPDALPGLLRPPHTVVSAALPLDDPRSRYHGHRRLALAALAPLLTVLGALLGGALGGARALLGGTALLGSVYWALRAGDLGVRAGTWDAAVAGWLPVTLAAGIGLISAFALARRFRA